MVVEPGRGGGGWWVRGAAAHCTLHGRGEEEGEKIRNGGDRERGGCIIALSD